MSRFFVRALLAALTVPVALATATATRAQEFPAAGKPIRIVAPFNLRGSSDLVARTNPGKINYGSAGAGNTQHLTGEQFTTLTGTKLNHIPYHGASPAGHEHFILAPGCTIPSLSPKRSLMISRECALRA